MPDRTEQENVESTVKCVKVIYTSSKVYPSAFLCFTYWENHEIEVDSLKRDTFQFFPR